MIKKMNNCLGLEEANGLFLAFQTVLCQRWDNYQRTEFRLSCVFAVEAAGLNFVLSQHRQMRVYNSQRQLGNSQRVEVLRFRPQAQRKARSCSSKECQACLSIKAGWVIWPKGGHAHH